MKNYFLFLFTFFITTNTAICQIKKKVLFIGNSYTYTNNLPLMLSNMAASTGDILTYDGNTPGGYRFRQHAVDATTLSKISSNNWDYVILQAQSQETSWGSVQMGDQVFPFATLLCDSIRANYSCSQPMFYMTWGRKNGDAFNCSSLPYVCTYDGMDSAINSAYLKMAKDNKALVSPVGEVWHYIVKNHPTIELYSPDESHPSIIGTYLAACTFYTMIYKQDPTLITWNSGLSTTITNTIKEAVKSIVYDKQSSWSFTENPAIANFSEIIHKDSVVYTSAGSVYDSLHWDFGDGNMSNSLSPTHIYLASGNYTVSLTSYKCGDSSVKTQTIAIVKSSVGIAPYATSATSPIIYPNPNSGYISVQHITGEVSYSIFDTPGRLVMHGLIADNEILTIKHLHNGIYFIQLDNGAFTKLIKE